MRTFWQVMGVVRRHVPGGHYPALEKLFKDSENDQAAQELLRIVRYYEDELDRAKRGWVR